MADRTSAEIFATMFEMLAKNPTDEHKQMAKKLWRKRNHYDFSDYQMGCDDALIVLDLAKRDGEEIEYKD
jgi:hypothetical protein